MLFVVLELYLWLLFFYLRLSHFYLRLSPTYLRLSPFYLRLSPFYLRLSPSYLRLSHFYLRLTTSPTFLLLNAPLQFAFLLLVKMVVFELLLFPLLFGEAHLFFQDYPLTPCISCVVLLRIDS